MIPRIVEKVRRCPRCGELDPFIKISTRALNRPVNGDQIARRTYKRCRKCGLHVVFDYAVD